MADTVKCFATYGTLRFDDDSNSTWNESFIKDSLPGQYAIVRGYKMYHKRIPTENWPYAVQTNHPDDYIVVTLIRFPDHLFDAKLVEADGIEKYDPEQPENSWYQRTIVKAYVFPEDTTEVDIEKIPAHAPTVDAIMYYLPSQPKLDDNQQLFPVQNGDWMKRDRTFVS